MSRIVKAAGAPSTQSDKPLAKPPSLLTSTFHWCETKPVVDEVNFEWTIERLAIVDDNKWETLTSAEFSESKFKLSISSVFNSYSGYIVDIHLLCSTSLKYSSRVEVVIFNEEGKKISQETSSYSPKTRVPFVVLSIGQEELMDSGNFVNGKMIIHCKIESLLTRNHLTKKTTGAEKEIRKTLTGDNDQNPILDQLGFLFSTMDLSDVTFNIRGSKFAAHKTILSMRSKVFAAMFRHPTKEVLSNQVEVEDIDPKVFQEVLRFIYTGKTQSTAMNKMAPGLLAAADKYLLEDLKSHSETHLIRQMSAENCLELLSLSTNHPAEHLKKYAVDYFRRYPDDVMKTNTWKKMKKENPTALCDLQQMVLTAPTI